MVWFGFGKAMKDKDGNWIVDSEFIVLILIHALFCCLSRSLYVL